ncbi:MBL fold metallo-hydrolase [Clostridium sp. 29_15]|uniref:MBL fold metallo-hydrolase n=1 Tax=Clostridium sp. 29_15 TaxID=1896982 RepID=UPI00095F8B8F|nr:MBL fold metallo-hydrolase [Clostridium sp. 29_15]OKZ87053.1 MAG: MBL fold metallo-hydrolase [Clostridium sp. 29_15]
MKFCSLYSGSSGNSIFIASDNAKVLIDAGLAGKKIDDALKHIGEESSSIDGIFITHEHIDHIKGVGVLSRKYDIPIYANDNTWAVMEKNIGKIKEHNIRIMDRRSSITINDLEIKSFNIPHDAIAPVGYTVSSAEKNASVVTDFGVFTEEIRDNIIDSDIILLESNHDVNMLRMGPYPYKLKLRVLGENGHLSNEDCGSAIVSLLKNDKKKQIVLGHLSGTNNHPDLAYQTVVDVLSANGIRPGDDVILQLASRHNPSEIILL